MTRIWFWYYHHKIQKRAGYQGAKTWVGQGLRTTLGHQSHLGMGYSTKTRLTFFKVHIRRDHVTYELIG